MVISFFKTVKLGRKSLLQSNPEIQKQTSACDFNLFDSLQFHLSFQYFNTGRLVVCYDDFELPQYLHDMFFILLKFDNNQFAGGPNR